MRASAASPSGQTDTGCFSMGLSSFMSAINIQPRSRSMASSSGTRAGWRSPSTRVSSGSCQNPHPAAPGNSPGPPNTALKYTSWVTHACRSTAEIPHCCTATDRPARRNQAASGEYRGHPVGHFGIPARTRPGRPQMAMAGKRQSARLPTRTSEAETVRAPRPHRAGPTIATWSRRATPVRRAHRTPTVRPTGPPPARWQRIPRGKGQ